LLRDGDRERKGNNTSETEKLANHKKPLILRGFAAAPRGKAMPFRLG
jgi:hypothetical protein